MRGTGLLFPPDLSGLRAALAYRGYSKEACGMEENEAEFHIPHFHFISLAPSVPHRPSQLAHTPYTGPVNSDFDLLLYPAIPAP